MVKNAIIENLKCDIFGDFRTLCNGVHCVGKSSEMSRFPTFWPKTPKISKILFWLFDRKNSDNFGHFVSDIILSQISFCFAHGEKKMRLFLGLVSCPNCIPYFSMQNMTRTELHSTYFPAVVRIIASQLLSLFHLLELPILLMF